MHDGWMAGEVVFSCLELFIVCTRGGGGGGHILEKAGHRMEQDRR